ncbi:MAG: CDP-alcohol phosphatidyltransferase family protein [Phycisphaerae bacterium]|nr:CDP-alcohol phosphatidyltransferase family protein [Phycisphaerae bacterium]
MIGRSVGFGFATARDAIARGLVRLHVTPNTLSLIGAALTCGAGVCYALGAGADGTLLRAGAWSVDAAGGAGFLLPAGLLLVLASACDMLDGAVARIGTSKTAFGGFLDSTLDRLSDFAVYAGIAIGFARREPANLTFCLLAMVAVANAYMISYTKARAEDFIDTCSVGFWQRGERSTAVLIGTFAGHVPALMIQQALLPALTVWRRVRHTQLTLRARAGRPVRPLPGWLDMLRLWRAPRMTVSYDLVVAVNIAWLLLADLPATDVLRTWWT